MEKNNLQTRTSASIIARQSLQHIFRQRTVTLLAVLFVALVMVSSYLGWSATTTVNAIYQDAVVYLAAQGQPAPPNPVHDISALSLMRNMSIYVSLIGALAAIVIGYQLIATDRNSGVLPLLGSRPLDKGQYIKGKLAALLAANGVLAAVAGVIAAATFLILPQISLTAGNWLSLSGFFVLAYAYMIMFGMLGMASAAWARSETVGLLLPVTLWLTVTFVLPSITGNIHPTAAINPISALAPAPDSAFFHWTGMLVGPLSVAESFKYLSADLLNYLPAGISSRSLVPPLPDLGLALILSSALAVRAVSSMDVAKGDYDV